MKGLQHKKPKAYKWCRQTVEELYDCGIPDFDSIDNDIMALYKFIKKRQDEWDDLVRVKIKLIIKYCNNDAKLQNADTIRQFFTHFDDLLAKAKLRMPWAVPPELMTGRQVESVIPKDLIKRKT